MSADTVRVYDVRTKKLTAIPARELAPIYRSRLPNGRVSVIARVGYDVAASCGMFFGPGGPESRR